MKLNAVVARLVLVAGDVTLNTGPVTSLPKTDTVMGPVVTPNGTIVVIAFVVALMTRAEIPLNLHERRFARADRSFLLR